MQWSIFERSKILTMKRERILITVKTYPTPSEKYGETVCTAGVREDGSWVRIYPMQFRKLDESKKYKKYQWIELDLERNIQDFRPESYKPKNLDQAVLGEVVATDKDPAWLKRRKIVLQNVHYSMTDLIEAAKTAPNYTSLAVYKPKAITDLIAKKYTQEQMKEYEDRVNGLAQKAQQLDIFSGEVEPFELVEKIPYKFSYQLIDADGTQRTMMIEDWEINMLYRKCLEKANGDEAIAVKKVREKYFDDFVKTKDLHLFLGTTKAHHLRAPNPFIIIGTFHPKHDVQTSQGRLF